jgi:osmotically-inducible protein OsmY
LVPPPRGPEFLTEETMQWRYGLCLTVLLAASSAWAQTRRPIDEPPSRAQGAGPTDEERAKSIEAQLQTDPVLRDDQVSIEVTGKRVRLSGTVDTADERSHAEEVVRQSDPTLTVENLLLTNNDREPPAATTKDKVSESTKRAAHKAEKAATEAGEMITDGWITSKVKTQLMAADGVHASAINVDTTDHVVTLRGHVRSEAERRKAVKLARETRGVDRVLDQLTIVTGRER